MTASWETWKQCAFENGWSILTEATADEFGPIPAGSLHNEDQERFWPEPTADDDWRAACEDIGVDCLEEGEECL